MYLINGRLHNQEQVQLGGMPFVMKAQACVNITLFSLPAICGVTPVRTM